MKYKYSPTYDLIQIPKKRTHITTLVFHKSNLKVAFTDTEQQIVMAYSLECANSHMRSEHKLGKLRGNSMIVYLLIEKGRYVVR